MRKTLLCLVAGALLITAIPAPTAQAVDTPVSQPEASESVSGALAALISQLEETRKDFPPVSMTDTVVYVDNTFICTAEPIFDDDTNYVPFTAMAKAMGAEEVIWDQETGTITATAEGLEISGNLEDPYLVANGRYLYMPDGATVLEGEYMIPVRVLCRAFNAEVTWSERYRTILVENGEGFIECGDDFYHSDSLYWLSRIINAESGNQPLDGMIAVGNVVMNRVASPTFPNTIYKVIFQGVQFSPAVTGSVYRKPNAKAVIAAKLVLDGANVAGESLFFAANAIAHKCWAGRNRTVTMVIGGHTFFA